MRLGVWVNCGRNYKQRLPPQERAEPPFGFIPSVGCLSLSVTPVIQKGAVAWLRQFQDAPVSVLREVYRPTYGTVT